MVVDIYLLLYNNKNIFKHHQHTKPHKLKHKPKQQTKQATHNQDKKHYRSEKHKQHRDPQPKQICLISNSIKLYIKGSGLQRTSIQARKVYGCGIFESFILTLGYQQHTPQPL